MRTHEEILYECIPGIREEYASVEDFRKAIDDDPPMKEMALQYYKAMDVYAKEYIDHIFNTKDGGLFK